MRWTKTTSSTSWAAADFTPRRRTEPHIILTGTEDPSMSGDRCVLWMERAGMSDAELLGALERKGLSVETSTNAFDAIARLCLASRPSADSSRPTAAVLLLCDPDRLHDAGEVARLAAKYAPKSKTWIFDSATRRLRAATAEDSARWSGTEVRFGSAVRAHGATVVAQEPQAQARGPSPRKSTPALRLTGRGTLPPQPDAEPVLTPDKAGQAGTQDTSVPHNNLAGLLTDEELAMLLSPDDPTRQD